MVYDNYNGTVLKKEGTYYHVRIENQPLPITNVKNTTPAKIDVGDKVIVSYAETPHNPIITGVYNKTGGSGGVSEWGGITGDIEAQDDLIDYISEHGGEDGHTPYIQNGYWFINGVSTNVKAQGEQGEQGVGVLFIEEYFALSDSNTTAPTSWSVSVPRMTPNNMYLWSYSEIYLTSGVVLTTRKRVIGAHGYQGIGLMTIRHFYALSNSNTVAPGENDWVETPLTTTQSQPYLWYHMWVVFSDGTVHPSPNMVIGTHGSKGEQGDPGTIDTPTMNLIIDQVKNELLERDHPVGSCYFTFIVSDNPNNRFPGTTWVRIEENTYLVSAGNGVNALDSIGSNKHTLSIDEIPSHPHDQDEHNHGIKYDTAGASGTAQYIPKSTGGSTSNFGMTSVAPKIHNTGGGQPHNNMPKSIAIYMWRRTA